MTTLWQDQWSPSPTDVTLYRSCSLCWLYCCWQSTAASVHVSCYYSWSSNSWLFRLFVWWYFTITSAATSNFNPSTTHATVVVVVAAAGATDDCYSCWANCDDRERTPGQGRLNEKHIYYHQVGLPPTTSELYRVSLLCMAEWALSWMCFIALSVFTCVYFFLSVLIPT